MDEHDQALAWAQANPKDPRAEHIMAKAWANKNPDDPRAQSILSMKPAEPSVGEKLMSGSPYLQNVQKTTDEALSPQGVERIGANALLPGAGAALTKGAKGGIGLLLRSLASAGQGAATGAANAPEGSRGRGALGGAAVGLGLGSLGEAAKGIGGKMADTLMQKAVGMSGPAGSGNELVDQGIVGTRGMMQNQVADRLGDAGEKIRSASANPALSAAKDALSQPTKAVPASLGDLIAGGLGGMVGHAPGAVAGVIAKKAASTPLVQSLAAQAAQKGGGAAQSVTSGAPLQGILQALFSQDQK